MRDDTHAKTDRLSLGGAARVIRGGCCRYTVSKPRARTKDQTRNKYRGAERLNID